MALWEKLRFWSRSEKAPHLERGVLGEKAARKQLEGAGLKFLTANFASKRGEIDLVFRDGTTLVFVEVKTRSQGGWTRPARAVDRRKRLALARAAQDYLKLLEDRDVAYRFDVVEVILAEGEVNEVRHLRNSFHSAMAFGKKKRRG